ncbi:unnamed protein product [Cylindrotheca closterium]|uniref:Uncharacterized protein n=1 Tax=Cylindrotheca closterium TaxID=2856 RepID=A0AAD2FCI7_9STRA|nr:unnamed protein product [Cylindrotheca closterium]CAJ1958936.1 unnamed protein product [Cylindrotheca closterium]
MQHTASSQNEREKDKKEQGTILSFLSPRKPPEKDHVKMGLQSQHTVGRVKAMKKMGQERQLKRTQQLQHGKPAKRQKTMTGNNAEKRCDEGTKTCPRCFVIKNGGAKKCAHDPTCRLNKQYYETDGGRLDKVEVLQRRLDTAMMARNNRPFEGMELHSSTIPKSQADVNKFFSQRKNVELPPSSKSSMKEASLEDQLSPFSVQALKERINRLMANCSVGMTNSSSVPKVIGAAIDALLETHKSITCGTEDNVLKIKDKRGKSYWEHQNYQRQFPPGTLGFTFPRDDKTKSPDHNYSQLEGVTIYLVRWELNLPGIQLICPECRKGELIHQKYDYKTSGFATPIIDISGVTSWACSMKYKCNNTARCDYRCKGNDGPLLAQLPAQFRNAYPVDPRYALSNKRHLSQTFTNVMDKLMITHGNGDQLAQLLSETRGDKHLDKEEEYYNQARDTGTTVTEPFPVYEDWIGQYSPSGKDLRDMKDVAAHSALISTGVSDKDRVCREIQSVGAKTTTCDDHTYAVLGNYRPEDIQNAKCAHSIGTETGEIASVVIVPSEEQTHYAHQAAQFSRRPNVCPKVHVSDICPRGTRIWNDIFSGCGITCRLGWFHYLQRITKTLVEDHELYRDAIRALQECLYYYDEGDLAAVMQQISAGNLGKVDGKVCPEENQLKRAKQYRQYVRVWSYKATVIQSKLAAWYRKFKDEYDDTIHADLFTGPTETAVEEQMKNAIWVEDILPKDDLYFSVKPGLMSKCKLPVFIGTRGAESKVEKGNHIMHHCSNGGTRRTLTDYTSSAGIALYNLRIRYRLHIGSLDPKLRKKIPTAFHRAPHYTNHLRLAFINNLAKEAGIIGNVHSRVEELPADNGERFFSEYLTQQLARESSGVLYDEKTKRCKCKDCSKIKNPYAKRRVGSIQTAHAGNISSLAGALICAEREKKNRINVTNLAPHPTIMIAPRQMQLPPQHYFLAPAQSAGRTTSPHQACYHQQRTMIQLDLAYERHLAYQQHFCQAFYKHPFPPYFQGTTIPSPVANPSKQQNLGPYTWLTRES